MFIDPNQPTNSPSARRAMFIDPNADQFALRQEGYVYRPQRRPIRPPPGGPCS